MYCVSEFIRVGLKCVVRHTDYNVKAQLRKYNTMQ